MNTYENSKIPNLFLLMEEKGIRASKLSKDLSISPGNISDWKSGKASPTNAVVHALADYLETTTAYLLGETDIKEKALVNKDAELTEYLEELRTRPEMRMLFSLAKGATKEDVQKAVAIIEALRKNGEEN